MGKQIPQCLLVVFRRTDSGELLREEVLTGYYDLVGEHYGRPVYRRRPTGQPEWTLAGSGVIILHYWGGDGTNPADAEVGWWFGPRIGSEEVWAFHDLDSLEPPRRGWLCLKVCGNPTDGVELVIEPYDGEPALARRHQPPPRRARRRDRSGHNCRRRSSTSRWLNSWPCSVEDKFCRYSVVFTAKDQHI